MPSAHEACTHLEEELEQVALRHPERAHDDASVLQPTGLLRALPLGVLAAQCVGSPSAGWALCAGALTPPQVLALDRH